MRPANCKTDEVEARIGMTRLEHFQKFSMTCRERAAVFGVSRQTITNWMRELGLEVEQRSGVRRTRKL